MKKKKRSCHVTFERIASVLKSIFPEKHGQQICDDGGYHQATSFFLSLAQDTEQASDKCLCLSKQPNCQCLQIQNASSTSSSSSSSAPSFNLFQLLRFLLPGSTHHHNNTFPLIFLLTFFFSAHIHKHNLPLILSSFPSFELYSSEYILSQLSTFQRPPLLSKPLITIYIPTIKQKQRLTYSCIPQN